MPDPPHPADGPARRSYPGEGTLVAGSAQGRPEAGVGGLDGPRPRWLRLVSVLAIAAVVGVVAFSGYWVVRLTTNVDSLHLNANGGSVSGVDDRKDRLQILVLGSDTRSGANSGYGPEEDSAGYGQADVMMLLDISADNEHVNVLSFPRDLLVDIPACTDGRGSGSFPARPSDMINSAMRDAGPGCAVDTINAVTGLEVDHFMLADFNAVTELSNAVGGVDVCVTEAIDEPKSGLKLPAGTSSVQGEQALAFLRARAAFGDGGDLGRIQAQQAFLGSLTRKIKDDGTLRNPQRLLGIADALTSNLTVDTALASIPAMVTIADRLKDIDPAKVSFIAVPTVPAADPNRLVLDEPLASELFTVLKASADLAAPAAGGEEPADAAPGGAPGAASEEPTDNAGEPTATSVPVTVADGTAGADVVASVVTELTGSGYLGAQTIPAPATPLTGVYYGEGFEDAARAVAVALGLPAPVVTADPSVYGVQVYVGADAVGGLDQVTAPEVTDAVNQTADQVSCQDTNPFG
ncbi:LytR family transcriptional regulator [Arthrobacter agilis]|uniref:LCP family protein n=1 Tax=Arthrobacter agilis TaxID=37921 RepID=UPI000B35D891|nr:LCP family protein [Arthrobacter agilis]OUM43240.1 transcriptional regulator [Arthrobacter agilis]PPB46149.1 LytR family transcriptional regulator [Arthrobacter agilis]TPV25726.1 LytR family transcriptional regulator [Arthrobacter agilis]